MIVPEVVDMNELGVEPKDEAKSGLILCLLGLPGSGKTSLAHRLSQGWDESTHWWPHLTGAVLHLLSVDSIVPIKEQSDLVKEPGAWKEMRRSILVASDAFLRHLNDPTAERCPMLAPADKILEAILNANRRRANKFVLLIDDNLYYRSMRHEWYQLARRHRLGFAQIFFDFPLEECLQRNQRRSLESRVDDMVIVNMNNAFEKPVEGSFESNLLTLAPGWDEELDLTPIWTLISNGLSRPLEEVPDLETLREQDRLESLCNTSHQLDCLLRQVIGKLIQTTNSQTNREQTASQLSRAKRLVLNHVKDNRLHLPDWFVSDLVNPNMSHFNEKCLELAKRLLSNYTE